MLGAGLAPACAQLDANRQTRDLGLPPPYDTPLLPPPVNPNLPPPTGQRYLPGAGGPFANPDAAAPRARRAGGSSGDVVRATISSHMKIAQAPAVKELTRLDEIVPYLRRCWRTPAVIDLNTTPLDATIRMSLARDGRVIGQPRITYVNRKANPEQRTAMMQSIADALKACAPFPLSQGLGNAVAGRIFSIRFIFEPKSTAI